MTSCEFDANAPSAHVPLVARCGNGSINMRQGNILNEATAVSLATFLGEAIRLVIQIVARHGGPFLRLGEHLETRRRRDDIKS